MDEQQYEVQVRFGRELNRMRRWHRFTQARLANDVGVSQAHIGNIERGERRPDLQLVSKLDVKLYAEGRLERLWATLTGDGEPVWLDDLAELERRAVSILETHTVLFPALLQTQDYARAVIRAISPLLTSEEVEQSVKSRMERATRFASATSPAYRAVLDGSIVGRRWGDDEAMRQQLANVVDLIETGRIAVQIIDASTGHPGLVGPFTLLASSDASDVVYVESAHAGRMVDDRQQVQGFRLLFSDIQAVALSPERSLRWIRDKLEGMRQ